MLKRNNRCLNCSIYCGWGRIQLSLNCSLWVGKTHILLINVCPEASVVIIQYAFIFYEPLHYSGATINYCTMNHIQMGAVRVNLVYGQIL